MKVGTYCRALLPALVAATAGVAGDAVGEDDWRALVLDARPVFETRYRFEWVDQDGLPENARAHTVRTRAGLQSGRLHGFGAAIDIEWIEAIGGERFNSTTNGRTAFPVVADPDDFQVNQLYLISENTLPDTTVTLGRQRIIWDNARFIGNVGFRQNEQTFDAVRVEVAAIPDLAVEYVYLDEVHRIFGENSPQGEHQMEGHGARARFTGLAPLEVVPFALLLDYDAGGLAGLDSQTYGLHLDAARDVGAEVTLRFSGSAAWQADYADNPADFDHGYYRVEPGIGIAGVSLAAGYEVLEGDGTTAFQTPLATLHRFNGFADTFLATPPGGLEDLYLSISAPVPTGGLAPGLTFKAHYHEYWSEDGDAHYGSEWDAGLFHRIPVGFGAFDLGIQYASYDADAFARDTDKLWLTLDFRLDAGTFAEMTDR